MIIVYGGAWDALSLHGNSSSLICDDVVEIEGTSWW